MVHLRRSGNCGALSVAACVLLRAAAARAGNLDTYYHSGDAALQAGAITADARGGGAAWYNPAGLASLPELRFDVSVSAYSLRLGGRPDFNASENTESRQLAKPDFNIVPAAMTVTHHFGPIGVGFGVFVPQQRVTVLRTRLTYTGPESNGAGVGIDVNDTVQEYAVGPSLGFRLAPRVDFGFSLLASYRYQLSIAGVDASGATGASVTTHQTVDSKSFGLQPVLGLQLHPSRDYDIGFAVRMPSFKLYELRQAVEMSTGVLPGTPNTHQVAFDDSSAFRTVTTSPMRFHAGVSRRFGDSRLALEANYQAPFSNADSDWKPVLNLRLGGKHALGDRYTIGGGLFSDRAPQRSARVFGETKLDYYGLTIAVDRGSRYAISAENGHPTKGSRELRFGTTVALTYAVGLGKIVGSDGTLEPIASSAVVHDLILHVSTSLME